MLLKELKSIKECWRFPRDPPFLLLREWGAVFFIVILTATLIALSEATNVRIQSVLEKQTAIHEERKIEITLKGAVERPGVYRCTPGTSLRELLKEAKPLKRADRRSLILNRIMYSSQEIEIPDKVARQREGRTNKFR